MSNAKDLVWCGASIWLAGVVLGISAGPAIGHLTWVDNLTSGAVVAVAGLVTLLVTPVGKGCFDDCRQPGPFDQIAGAAMGVVAFLVRVFVGSVMFWTVVGAATFASEGHPLRACILAAIVVAMGGGILLAMGIAKMHDSPKTR